MTNKLKSRGRSLLRFLLVMVLLLIPTMLLAQHGKVSLNLQNEEVSQFIRQVEKQTNYTFVYRNSVLQPKTKVTCVCKDWPLEKALFQVFSSLGIQYSFNNNTIVLVKGKNENSERKGAKPSMGNTPSPSDKNKLSGIVRDVTGEPIIGASVFVKGTKIGTITNVDGEFSLDVPANSTLMVSYIGFATREIPVKNHSNLKITLDEDAAHNLNEVVVVGYGTQKKTSVTGAIASVTTKDLVQTPQANISNMLVGKMPGLIAMQRSGAPGEDNSTLLIRGVSTFSDNTAPLVMIDGVERPNYNGLDPNEIESVSILKDASATAIYGVRGANGVILITTRKGQKGKPHLSYSGNVAVQSPTALPHYLNSAQYCEMYNEALKNDAYTKGTSYVPRFTDEDIKLYRNGTDPIMHPSTDWVGTFLRKASMRTQHNFNISGGTDRVKYFISAGVFNQGGMYKYTKIDRHHDVNASDTRYNFRSNLDFNITQDFRATVQLSSQINNIRTPGLGNSNLWKEISWATPLGTPGMVDGKLVRLENTIDDENPWQALLNNGYNDINANTINTTLRFEYDLSRLLLKGLSIHASTSYDSYYNSKRFSVKTMQTFVPKRDPSDPTKIVLVPQNEASTWGGGFEYDKNRKVYFEAGLHYDGTFGKHQTTVLLLYNQSKYYSPKLAYHVPNAYQGIVGRITYDYANRYLAEFNMGYNGTENFASGHRFGFFPAVSAGWVISEEPFFPKNNWVVYTKLRATYGEVGNDKIGGDRFLYLPSVYGSTSGELSGYNFGSSSDPVYSQMIEEKRLGNPFLTWEKARKLNIGADMNFLKNHLTVSFDYFKERRNNILSNRNSAPMLIGASLPAYNMGEMENSGFELDINYRSNFRDFNYWGRFNYSFARNKILFQDEVPEKYAYQMRTGRRVGQFFGLLFDGFYNSWEEINALDRPVSSWNGNRLQPGDMRYVDVNKDGKIDMYDMVPIGYSPTPEIIYGFSAGFSWRGFDCSALFQGASHVSIKYFGRALWPFINAHNSAKTLILERWTQERYERGEPISFPRLSMSPSRDTDNNYQDSNFWIRNADYLRLKNVEIGYTFRKGQLKVLGLESLRLYVSGTNLFTWTNVIDLDPEAPSKGGATEINTYPLQKIYNVGINIQF
ncbi:TonB-dependent receptor plug [Hallella multisaccharivorax DSM 17128]|uniref:TonB-dependent receptor plug n=1 Tax=Hallella multisaccharivorax DSM 17128 TaxID=688246 RepID=F8N9W3_9BACT|nr:TonB-dependent receptor [Hallella multisaccharivorax]EGN57780.1 TonB-dependent receptor plug [Hallella multisaccharivorax DSM 17128]